MKTVTQHSTAQHSTAQHSTAQHSTAQHSTAHEDNLLIQGDNLEALKALLPHYEGRVKCIFIDPPYNTGSAFTHYDDKLEHNIWLAMMYPRLKLLHQLLAEDGSLWVTIDDNEAHYLKVMLDEIFVRENFVANVVWEKKYSPQNDAKWLSDNHDHVLVYARNKTTWRPNGLQRTEAMDARFKNPDSDPRGVWKPSDFSVKTYSINGDYEITTPSGRKVKPPKSRSWGSNEATYEELLADNRIWFGKAGSNVPSLKKFLTEVQDSTVSMTIWKYVDVGHNQDAKKEIKALIGEVSAFDTPKPERLLERIFELATKPNDLVLDSFLGSGTTAAVAQKMGRKWIGIESGNHATTHCIPRLQKVIDGEHGGISQSVDWKGGGGFAFYTLGEQVFLSNGHINSKIKFNELAEYVWQCETSITTPLPHLSITRKTQKQNPTEHKDATPLLGIHNGTAYFLLYNGILKDRRPEGGNVLTSAVWLWLQKLIAALDTKPLQFVVYCDACFITKSQREKLGITFKQMPYKLQKI